MSTVLAHVPVAHDLDGDSPFPAGLPDCAFSQTHPLCCCWNILVLWKPRQTTNNKNHTGIPVHMAQWLRALTLDEEAWVWAPALHFLTVSLGCLAGKTRTKSNLCFRGKSWQFSEWICKALVWYRVSCCESREGRKRTPKKGSWWLTRLRKKKRKKKRQSLSNIIQRAAHANYTSQKVSVLNCLTAVCFCQLS